MWGVDDTTIAEFRRLLDVRGYEALQAAVVEARALGRRPASASEHIDGYLTTWAINSYGTAVDHLRAWWIIADAGLFPIMAHATLARAALDGVVVCLWLLDGGARSRLQRAVSLQIEDQDERRKFEEAGEVARPTHAHGRTGEERRDLTQAHAREAGIAPVRVPRWTELYRDFALDGPARPRGGEALYRLLSAHAHGASWAFMTLDLSRSEARVGEPAVGMAKDEWLMRFARVTRAGVDRSRDALASLLPPGSAGR